MLLVRSRQRRFVIVTTEANDVAAEVHERMPVVLDRRAMDVWLLPDTPPGPLRRICQPYDGDDFSAEQVAVPPAPRRAKPDPRQGVLNL